jgi:diphosphomevalonate decarboxylase
VRAANARAFANIALVKYWGKRDRGLNLPCTGSLSLTLAPLATHTTARFDPSLAADSLTLNGQPADARATGRVSRLLDLMRAQAQTQARAEVVSVNDFPTAAGLASSASAFAALVKAADAALGLGASDAQLSVWARRGSGSAARSLFGGFCEMRRGERADGEDAFAVPLFDEGHWPLAVVIAVITARQKEVASTDGMDLTARTSPFFSAWCAEVPPDLAAARAAIAARDFDALGAVAERSCLRMHASALAADPGVLYWQGATVDTFSAVRRWRAQEGLPVFFTIDAGPNVKVFCPADAAPAVAQRLRDLPGVQDTITCAPGAGATARVLTR